MATLTRTGLEVAVTVPTAQETYRLIMQRLGHRMALNWIAEINEHAVVIATEFDDYHRACSRLARFSDQDISLADAMLSIVSDRLRIPVWTYDHHFDILGAARWYPAT